MFDRIYTQQQSKWFLETRPKPTYVLKGLGWDPWAKIHLGQVQKVTYTFLATTAGKAKTGLPSKDTAESWPPLIKKLSRYQQGDPTDLLWSKKRDPHQQGGPTDLLDVQICDFVLCLLVINVGNLPKLRAWRLGLFIYCGCCWWLTRSTRSPWG